jgi:hypothetical protein
VDSRNVGNGGAGPEIPLPPDASNTLFIEGVPTDCTRREVSRILESVHAATKCFFSFLRNIYLHIVMNSTCTKP